METSSCYEIDLNRISDDAEGLRWHIGRDFFAQLDGALIDDGDLDATLRVHKTSGAFDLEFAVAGEVSIPCDRCLEAMRQPIETSQTLQVRLGEEFADDGDVITVPAEEPVLDVAWNLYEIIALAVPIHHVHPEGQCSSDMAELLTRHTASADTDDGLVADSPFAILREKLEHNGTSDSQAGK